MGSGEIRTEQLGSSYSRHHESPAQAPLHLVVSGGQLVSVGRAGWDKVLALDWVWEET